MTYAAILVHVQAGGEGQPRLDRAVALARRFDATLIGLGAEMIPPVMPEDGIYPVLAGWAEMTRASIEERLEGARAAFVAARADLAKPAVWESGVRMPTRAMVHASRAADLVVAGATGDFREDPYRDASAAEIVLASGRPVLVVPVKAPPLAAERMVLAWKDTREARRAMTDAMPFLKRAREVLVLEVGGADDGGDATLRTNDVASALARHGVSATGKVVPGPANARQIIHQAATFGADLVVAGAYGHSRVGEWVFGGVTRDLLDQDDHHVLLSH